MSYSCSDFTDSILDALNITVPDESADSPSDQADLALAEIERLKSLETMFVGNQPVGMSDAEWNVRRAMVHLKRARDLLAFTSPKAADKVRSALKSTEGARRHAQLAPYRNAHQVEAVS